MKPFGLVIFMLSILVSCNKRHNVVEDKSVTNDHNHEAILEKYAEKLQVKSSELSKPDLYTFIDQWYGTKYKYGGMSKSGVDCSGFCNLLYNNVYQKELPRMTGDIAESMKSISKNDLEEGDLVLFNISGKPNSHVGVYLVNNYFVHASTSKGVIISSLNNPYYQKSFSKGGRI